MDLQRFQRAANQSGKVDHDPSGEPSEKNRAGARGSADFGQISSVWDQILSVSPSENDDFGAPKYRFSAASGGRKI